MPHPLRAVSSVLTFNSLSPEWGWKNIVEASQLSKSHSSGFVVNGKLMISTNVTVEEDNAAPVLMPGGFSVGDEVVWNGPVRSHGNGRVEKGMRGTVMGSKARVGFDDDLVIQLGSDQQLIVDEARWFGHPASCPEEDVFEETGLLVGAELAGQTHVLVTGTAQSNGWRASRYHGEYVRNCSMREDVMRFHCGRCLYTCKETGSSIHFLVDDSSVMLTGWFLRSEGSQGTLEVNTVASTASTPVDIGNWIHVKRESMVMPFTSSAGSLQVTTVERIHATNNAILATAGGANVVLLEGSMPYDLHDHLRGAYTRLDWLPLSNGRYVYAHEVALARWSHLYPPPANASGHWMWSAAAPGGSSKSCWYVGPRALIGSRKGLCASACRTLGVVPSMSYRTCTKLHPRCDPILAQFAHHAAESFRPVVVLQVARRGHGASPRVRDDQHVEGVG